MIARRRHPILPALFAIAIAATLTAPAAAQDRDCRTLRAFANADGRNLADLQLGIDPGSGVELRSGRDPSELSDAESCDVEADRNGILASCQWSFRDHAGAVAFFEPMLERLRRCLDHRLPAGQITRATPDWTVMRRHQAEFVAAGSETQLEFQLIEWDRRADQYLPASLTYFVELDTELEFEEADPIDDEEE